jgi:hypothetical protein
MQSIGTVKVITVSFLEDDVHDGGIPNASYENARVDEYDVEDVEEAIRVIQYAGLTFEATGNDWAGHPDGSSIHNYATGERHDVTAHLERFLPSEVLAIIEAVG